MDALVKLQDVWGRKKAKPSGEAKKNAVEELAKQAEGRVWTK